MKKNYRKPMTEQFHLNVNTAILAGSGLTFDGNGATGSGTLSDDDADSEAMSKGSSLWD